MESIYASRLVQPSIEEHQRVIDENLKLKLENEQLKLKAGIPLEEPSQEKDNNQS